MFFQSNSTPGRNRRAPLRLEVLERRDTPTAAVGNDLIWKPYASSSAFTLHSDPGAGKVIYMDFDGDTVSGTGWNTSYNGGNPFTVPAWSMDGNRAAFSTVEQDKIISMWRTVAEDFAPFDVDVTTQDPGVAGLTFSGAGDTTWGVRVVIGADPGTVVSGSPTAWPVAGGLAFVGTFKSAIDLPCFVWNGDMVANPEFSLPDTVSHEAGHTLGLSHDGTLAPVNPYYGGHGAGAVSWGPIMGGPFGRNLTQWSRNTYPSADNPEDDLAIIASAGNGFGYRPDDYGNTTTTAQVINGTLQANLNTTYGIIEKSTDTDYFSFKANPGQATIKIDPLFVSPNLDIKAELYSANGALLQTSNPLNLLNATLSMYLPTKGAYFIKITGTGLAAGAVAGNAGYSNYGSLGNYRITGTVTPYTPLASSISVLNPTRWAYAPATRTFDGYMTFTNISSEIFSGKFTFVLTLPSNVTVASGPGYQVGTHYYIPFTGTLSPRIPVTFKFKLSNPFNVPLLTGFSNYFSDVV